MATIALIACSLIVSPVAAQTTDPHAGHHPTAEAKSADPTGKAADAAAKDQDHHHCPMMDKNGAGVKPSADDRAAEGGMMKGGMMHDCMAAKPKDPAGSQDMNEHH